MKFTPKKYCFLGPFLKGGTTYEVGIENSLDLEIDDFIEETDQEIDKASRPVEVEKPSEDEVTMEVET